MNFGINWLGVVFGALPLCGSEKRMENIKLSEKVSSEEVLERAVRRGSALLRSQLGLSHCKKKTNYLLRDAIKRQMI